MPPFNPESGAEQLTYSQEMVNLLRRLGEDYGFDVQTCDEIAELSFEEAFETSYGYLVQAGLDPEDVLQDYLEQPEQ